MNEQKTVLITGVKGMDGSTLAEKYLAKGWKIVGIDTWDPTAMYPNLNNIFNNPNFVFITGDVTEHKFMERLFDEYKPDYVYNLAAISLVPESFKIPERVFYVNTLALLNMLEIIRTKYPNTKIYQASSSEQIGKNRDLPQNTESRMIPNSPYAVSKLCSYHLIRLYREAYNLFAVNGMLWNHEGKRRGPTFVTRKISDGVAQIKLGLSDHITLGNLDAYRDWGYAPDYVEAMWLILQQPEADDYIIATGETHSIREFLDIAFKHVGINDWDSYIKIDPRFMRPAEVDVLKGDYTKAKNELGWEPKTSFEELVKKMVDNDIKILKNLYNI